MHCMPLHIVFDSGLQEWTKINMECKLGNSMNAECYNKHKQIIYDAYKEKTVGNCTKTLSLIQCQGKVQTQEL